MKFCIKDFFSKCNQTRSFVRIWSHLLEKSLMENFIFCAVYASAYIPVFSLIKGVYWPDIDLHAYLYKL